MKKKYIIKYLKNIYIKLNSFQGIKYEKTSELIFILSINMNHTANMNILISAYDSNSKSLLHSICVRWLALDQHHRLYCEMASIVLVCDFGFQQTNTTEAILILPIWFQSNARSLIQVKTKKSMYRFILTTNKIYNHSQKIRL